MKVFDSFIFFNELELLEMRLNILGDVVDKFVLTESPYTVSGNEKPLYYQENKDKFAKWHDKIVHNITEEIPNDFSHMLEKSKFHIGYRNLTLTALHLSTFLSVFKEQFLIETIVALVLKRQEQKMVTL